MAPTLGGSHMGVKWDVPPTAAGRHPTGAARGGTDIVVDGTVVHAGGLPRSQDVARWLAA